MKRPSILLPITAIVVAPLLLGNKDLDHLLARPIIDQFDSPKSPVAMVECLASSDMSGRSAVIPGESRTTVTFGHGGHLQYVIVVTPSSSGSHVELHRWTAIQGKKYGLRSCQ